VYKTTNGGLNWTVNLQESGFNFNSIYFINNYTGWVAGGVGSPLYIGVIYKTTTGGVNSLKPIGSKIPTAYYLFQNFPNPFNPVTKSDSASLPSKGGNRL
jgi:hypothetical protein